MSETVTRRKSAGFVPAAARNTSVDLDYGLPVFFSLRRSSYAGLRAFMCSAGVESSASRECLRSIVLTPESIPQFTIPKLAAQERCTRSHEDKVTSPAGGTARKLREDVTHTLHITCPASSSSPSSSSPIPVSWRKARRSISDPDNHKRTSVRCSPGGFMENDQCLDPATRGALSLPHLAKITTPYGFVSLSQSPQMANEEELLLQTNYRSWASDRRNVPSRNLRAETTSGSSAGTLPAQNHPNHAVSHQVSRGSRDSESTTFSACSHSDGTQRPKQKLWKGLRKHLLTRTASKTK